MILPWATAPRTIALHEIPGKTIALSTIAPEFPLRTTIENCFELSRLESELHLSKASIVTGYPEGACKPLIRAEAIFYIFHCCCVTESRN